MGSLQMGVDTVEADPAVLAEAEAPLLPNPPSLKQRAIRGSMWTMVGYVGSQLLRFGSTLVLSRMLFPEVYGMMTIAGTLYQGLQMFSDVGVGPSIIQNELGDHPPFYNTAWTIGVLRGIALWLCASMLAWPMAKLYGQPELVKLLPVLAFTACLGGFNSTAIFALNRNLKLAKITALDISMQVVQICVTITWAHFSHTVWAIVVGSVVSSFGRMVASHFLVKGVKNRFTWDKECSKSLFRFGRWIFISTVLTFFAMEADKIIYGIKIPLALLGVYNIADQFASLPTQAIIRIAGPITFSVYSRLREKSSSVSSVFSQVRAPLLTFAGFAITGLIVSGPGIIRLLFDSRYEAAGWILQLLVINAWFEILETTNGSALLALGKPSWIAAGNAAKLVGITMFIPLGFYFGGIHGNAFRGAIIGMIGSEIFRYATTAFAISREGFGVMAKDLSITLLAAVTAAVGLGLEYFVSTKTSYRVIPVIVAGLFVCAVWLPLAYKQFRILKPAKLRVKAAEPMEVAVATA